MNDSFVFYRSFAEAIEELPAEQYKAVMQAVSSYALNGTIPEDLDPVLKGYFVLMRPQIDANTKRRESGRKGATSRWQDDSNDIASDSKPIASDSNDIADECEPIANVNVNANVNANANVNDNAKKKAPKHEHGQFAHVLLSDDEYQKLKTDFGEAMTESAIDYLDEYIERRGYKSKSHYLAIRKWVFDALREEEIKKRELAEREKRLKNAPAKKNHFTGERNENLDEEVFNQALKFLEG